MAAPVTPPEVRLHDFRAPPPLPPERAAALRAFRTAFAAALRALLTPQVREVVDASAGDLDLLTAAGANDHFAAPAVRYRFLLGDAANGVAILELSPDLAARIVDRLCGGADDAAPAAGAARALSSIEQSLLGELLNRTLPLLVDALKEVATIAPGELRYVAVVDPAWLVRSGEHLAVARLGLRSGPIEGHFTIVLPLALVAGAAPEVTDAGGGDDAALVEQHLRAAAVPVTARVGCRVAALDIASLQVGTVIPTGHQLHGAVEVTVGGRRRFVGMLGREQEHVAVRILRPAGEDDATIRPNRRNPAA